jgi:hypothetical protein
MPPSKSRNSSPFTEERKEVIGTTIKTLQGSSIPLYEEHCWSTRREKNTKSQQQEHKGLKP